MKKPYDPASGRPASASEKAIILQEMELQYEEQHWTVAELAKEWLLPERTVRQMVKQTRANMAEFGVPFTPAQQAEIDREQVWSGKLIKTPDAAQLVILADYEAGLGYSKLASKYGKSRESMRDLIQRSIKRGSVRSRSERIEETNACSATPPIPKHTRRVLPDVQNTQNVVDSE